MNNVTTIRHYCPVCDKPIPQEAYTGSFSGCLELTRVTVDGWVCTAQGTIKLSRKPDRCFESIGPKAVFDKVYDAIRERQAQGDIKIGRC